jgi:hypothetical protein
MFHPCDTKNTFTLFSHNLPSHIGSRYEKQCVITNKISYIRYKSFIKQHLAINNGPGIIKHNYIKKTLYDLKDSIQIDNKIFKLPCLLIPYIEQIKELIKNGYSLQDAIDIIILLHEELNVLKPLPAFKRLYSYSNVNIRNTYSNTGNFSKPFIIHKSITFPSLSWNDIFNLPLNDNLFYTQKECQLLKFANNDGLTFSSDMNELLPNGSASFWGEKILYSDAYIKLVNSYVLKPNYQLPIIILPFNLYIGFGYIVNTKDYPILGITNPINQLLFIPIHSTLSIIKDNAYPIGTVLNIKTNIQITEETIQSYILNQIRCNDIHKYILFKNDFA